MYVDTEDKLQTMIKELSAEPIIGVDVEHHNYRTYLGITCLIQISSAAKDYLVDPFPLWAALPALNEITANPRIVKVLHGCDSDIDWLQRDFSLYLRNVFDTHQVGKYLHNTKNISPHSLLTVTRRADCWGCPRSPSPTCWPPTAASMWTSSISWRTGESGQYSRT